MLKMFREGKPGLISNLSICNFVHMATLIKFFNVDETLYRFLFEKIIGPYGDKYFVSAFNNSTQEKISFEIVQRFTEGWKVVHPVPDWIADLEENLSDFIEANHS